MTRSHDSNRRHFLKLVATSTVALTPGAFASDLIAGAHDLASGQAHDVAPLDAIEHVIIFMQENRSFEHYFGTLPGVRGYGDPRPAPVPGGNLVWYQPDGHRPESRDFSEGVNSSKWLDLARWHQGIADKRVQSYTLPFALDPSGKTQFQYITDLNHGWKQSQTLWENWDCWVPLKSRQSMGYLTEKDIPFYHRIATAFTICDNYHASVFGSTDPNRFYLFSGTCPPPMNFPDNYGYGPKRYPHSPSGGYLADIALDDNTDIKPSMYGQSRRARDAAIAAGIPDWETFAETLTTQGITWKVYQEYDNYGDNYLQYFKNFRIDNHGRPINESPDPYFRTLYQRGRMFAKPGVVAGEGVLQRFEHDVAEGGEPDHPKPGEVKPGLPRVSWIVAPYPLCEHPSASPGDGENFTSRLLTILIQKYPEIFQKSVVLLNYDENDGYFDHVPPPIPAISKRYGAMTIPTAGDAENDGGVPVGMGPRVPMTIISPWTLSGRVDSRLSDHTSVLRLLETWLSRRHFGTGESVNCKLISPWRRAVCGDFTEAFADVGYHPDRGVSLAVDFRNGIQTPQVPHPQVFPPQAPAVRPATPLSGVDCDACEDADGKGLYLINRGDSAVVFRLHQDPMSMAQNTRWYTLRGRSEMHVPTAAQKKPDFIVHGPGGLVRGFRGRMDGRFVSARVARMRPNDGTVILELRNRTAQAIEVRVADNAYYVNKLAIRRIGPQRVVRIAVTTMGGWYDVSVRVAGDVDYLRRFAGNVKVDKSDAITDPAMGNHVLFKPTLVAYRTGAASVRVDYAIPPWLHGARNHIGIFPVGAVPEAKAALASALAPRPVGSVLLTPPVSGRGGVRDYEAVYLDADHCLLAKCAIRAKLK